VDDAFKDLKTEGKLTPVLDIDVPMDRDERVPVQAGKIVARATLLGQNLFNGEWKAEQFDFGGELDPLTLNPIGVYVRLSQKAYPDGYPLAAWTLPEKKVSIPLSNRGTDFLFRISLDFKLKLAGSLYGNFGLQLNWDGKEVRFVPGTITSPGTPPSGTFFSLDGELKIEEVKAAATAELLEGYLAEAEASFTLHAKVKVAGTICLQGLVTSPQVKSYTLLATLSGDYHYRFIAKVAGITLYDSDEKDVDDNKKDKKTGNNLFGPYELFKIIGSP
jgi:hypothetical protein